MAHNIYKDANGKWCFYGAGERKDVCHQLGDIGGQAATAAEAMERGGLNWTVIKQQQYARDFSGKVVPLPVYAIFRSSDNAYLGTVGPDYTIRQNLDHFQYLDTLIEADGEARYDTAGALGNGARIFCSIRIPAADITVLGEDKQATSLMFYSSHDGSVAHNCKLGVTRPVCRNTVQALLSENGAGFKFKHTKNADARMAEAKHLLTGAKVDARILEQKLNTIAGKRLTREALTGTLDRLFPAPKTVDGGTPSSASVTRRENILQDIIYLYEYNDNNAIPAIRGTGYNLLNAITEYTDHFRSAKLTDARVDYTVERARAENAITGTGYQLKSQALEVLLETTATCPDATSRVYQSASVPVPVPAPGPVFPPVGGLLGAVIGEDDMERDRR